MDIDFLSNTFQDMKRNILKVPDRRFAMRHLQQMPQEGGSEKQEEQDKANELIHNPVEEVIRTGRVIRAIVLFESNFDDKEECG